MWWDSGLLYLFSLLKKEAGSWVHGNPQRLQAHHWQGHDADGKWWRRVRTTPGSRSCQLSLRCSELCVQTQNLATSHGASFDDAPGAPDALQPSCFKAEFAFTEQEPRLVQPVTVGSSINGDGNIDSSCAGNTLSHLTPIALRWLPSPFIGILHISRRRT